MPSVMLGVEGGVSLGASDQIGPNGPTDAIFNPLCTFDASARAGYVLGERNMLYIRGGYANTRARLTQNVGGVATSDKNNYDGWFVGGGAERKLLNDVSARIEYRYSDFGSENAIGKYESRQVLAGVAYRF